MKTEMILRSLCIHLRVSLLLLLLLLLSLEREMIQRLSVGMPSTFVVQILAALSKLPIGNDESKVACLLIKIDLPLPFFAAVKRRRRSVSLAAFHLQLH